jgi:3-polyprenyl-4-hydroxybenzoate decarboxylase
LIKNKKDYEKVLAQLNTEKEILGNQYNIILNQLNSNSNVKEILAAENEKQQKKVNYNKKVGQMSAPVANIDEDAKWYEIFKEALRNWKPSGN